MKHLIRRCSRCKRYTLKTTCPSCGGPTEDPHPPRFSVDDKYVSYRVRAKYGPAGEKDRAPDPL